MTAKTGGHTGGEELTEIYYEEVMQDEIFRLVNGDQLLGRSEQRAEAITEAIRDSSPRQEIRVAPCLTGDAKENTILVLVGKNFGWAEK